MEMEIRKLASMVRFEGGKMQKVNLFESERFFCDLYCLEPGQSQKRHAHAGEDKVYVVIDGAVEVSVGDEEATLGKGEAVMAPAGKEHGVVNESGEKATLLVFMAPHPDR